MVVLLFKNKVKYDVKIKELIYEKTDFRYIFNKHSNFIAVMLESVLSWRIINKFEIVILRYTSSTHVSLLHTVMTPKQFT